MLTTPFLTQLDSRAAIKGSRDPLSIQPLWSRLARHVIANLTTVSTSVRDFSVLLLGYHFAEQLAEEGAGDGDLSTFLKWEQLAAYARAHVNRERGFRGTERVGRRLTEGDRVRLSTDSDAQILANQKIYGLWGLYTVPGKASGLLDGDPTRLTAAGREVVERCLLPVLESAGPRVARTIAERLRARDWLLDLREGSRDAAVLAGVAKVLGEPRAKERAIYREHLLHGGPGDAHPTKGTRGKQQLFAELLTETLSEPGWTLTPDSLLVLVRRAETRGELGAGLAHRLARIRTAELLFAPAAVFFEYVLGCDGQTPADIARALRGHWGKALRKTIDVEATKELESELRSTPEDPDSAQRWLHLASALHESRYEDALQLALDQNAAVMKARSAAAPWAVLRDGKLQVKFRDEQPGRLPEADQLPTFWRHAYFIASLRTVAASLRSPR